MLKIKAHEIESYLRGKGLNFRKKGEKAECVLCPFCQGGDSKDTKTFVVYLDENGGNYNCLRGSCGATGSFWQLAEHYGDDPHQFYESNGNGHITRQTKKSPPPRDVKPVFKTEAFALRPFTIEAYEYLERRGFTAKSLDTVAIGCDEQGNICFEFFYNGEPCLVKCRIPKVEKGQKTIWAKWKGGLHVLWGLEQCSPPEPLVITFGEYDRIAVHQARVPNTVSVPGGDDDVNWIDLNWYDLEAYKTIILWIDNDTSGLRVLPKIAQRLGEDRVRVVRTVFKDANQMLGQRTKEVGREQAEDEIFEAVANAEWYKTADIIRTIDIPDVEQDFSGSYLTGFEFLNKALHGFLKGQMTVHTGDSKSGKSTALTQVSATCIEQGGIVCAWSGEDTDDSYKYRMQIHLGGFEGTEIRTSKAGREYAVLKPSYQKSVNEFLGDRSYLYTRRFGVTEANLVETFELALKRYGCDVFIVDNLMKIVAAKDTQQQYLRQAQIVNALSDFAKAYGVHVHIATHINKGSGADTEPPNKNSVSGAKEITNLADIVLSWWRVPEPVKDKYHGADAVCSILASRMFGDEESSSLQYDWRIKRFGESGMDFNKRYEGIYEQS